MIPKFLMADNSQDNPDRLYVVHTENPKFIIGFNIEDFNQDQELMWIDNEPDEKTAIELLGQANDFIEAELENQDDLFDEM